jgi:hypothetical protein
MKNRITKHIVATVTIKEIKDALSMIDKEHIFNKKQIEKAIIKTQSEYSGELWSAFIDQVIFELEETKK